VFGRRKRHTEPKPIPTECVGLEVRVESSTCTGEKTVGFYDPKSKRLLRSELVTSERDVEDFYAQYGLEAHRQ
jgi:hypothetical protein